MQPTGLHGKQIISVARKARATGVGLLGVVIGLELVVAAGQDGLDGAVADSIVIQGALASCVEPVSAVRLGQAQDVLCGA